MPSKEQTTSGRIIGGCTLWARKSIDSDIFSKPDKWFKIWFYLVNRVNHSDNEQFRQGECHLTYELIMLKCKATKAQVDHCIRWLKKNQMLATRKATRGFIISIPNYKRYQDLNNYKSDSRGDLKAIQKRHRSDTINKNEKNEKNTPLPPNVTNGDNCQQETKYKGEFFEQFWAIYPRKVGKQKCRQIWKRLKPSAELVEQIIKAVQAYKRTDQWKEDNGKYIPHPATWLHQGRWEDEIDAKPEPQRGDPDWLPTEDEVDELFRQTGMKP